MSLHPIYRLFSILQMLSFIIFSAPLSNVNLFTMIQLVSPEVCERKSVPRHALLELNLLNCTAGVTALHNKLRAVDSCTTKDTWGGLEVGWSGRGEEGDPLSFPIQGGAKIYVLSGRCNKTKRVRRCRLGTNMKSSGGWRQGDGAPPEDWMKLSLYNQGASAWLPPPLPSDR